MISLIDLLTEHSGLSTSDVHQIIRTAPRRYKVYSIEKRSGGLREIAQPAKEVKLLQRILLERFLSELPVHKCATAYIQDRSLIDNVAPHSGHHPVLKMDFRNFFPSIHGADWIKYCRSNNVLSDTDANLSSLLFFRKAKQEKTLKLSIGAPSSPMLSNILMHDFDVIVAAAADQRSITYTRYADDITFSGQRIGMLKEMLEVVISAIKVSKGPKLQVNRDKTIFVTSKFQRRVTGLVLTNQGKVSIGRDRKRLIRAQVHHFICGTLRPEDLRKLTGYLAFVNSVEPDFLTTLNHYYGIDVLHVLSAASAVAPRQKNLR